MKYCDFIIGVLSGNPYVQTGLYGYRMFFAARQADALLTEFDRAHHFVLNISTVLPQLIFFHVLMAQLLITGLTGVGAYFLLSAYFGNTLTSIAPPLIFILFISYSVVGVFTNLLAIVIATVTQDYAKCKYKLNFLFFSDEIFKLTLYILSGQTTYSVEISENLIWFSKAKS